MATQIGALPNALHEMKTLAGRAGGKRLVVFLDYDGTLTSIRNRPEEAVISASMREAVHRLAERIPVIVISGRDREDVQQLMGVDNLIVAGDHGFDIWSPTGATITHEEGGALEGPLREAEAKLKLELTDVAGVLIDPKLDWDKGKAVTYLLKEQGLDRDDVVPVYLGDDITDEDAFRVLAGKGIGILVESGGDAAGTTRATAADYTLNTIREVEEFINQLAAIVSREGTRQHRVVSGLTHTMRTIGCSRTIRLSLHRRGFAKC